MADVLEFASEHMAWLHGQVGILALERLDAGQFICANGAHPAPGPFAGTCIDLTSIANLLIALRIGHLIQPIAEALRLQAPFLSR